MATAGVFIGRFGRKFHLVYFSGDSIGVGLNGPIPTNKIAYVLGCGGTLHLHLTDTLFDGFPNVSFLEENAQRNFASK